MKVLFAPVGIGAGLVAGFAAQKAFEALWGVFDDEEAPEPGQREIEWVKLLTALAIEGAVFRIVKGVVDHGARSGFASLTGSWPGEERPDRA
ncbi:MAG: DUF4235 domain-containing protein [Solirubrobacterales bacterium]